MPKTIVLTDQTYRALLLRIESFDDTPEDVILRLLRQNDRAPASPAPDQLRGQEPLEEHRAEPERAAPGSILPEREYWRPILAVLAERGGSAHANDVIEAVGKRMERDLLPRDFEELRIGEIRWRNRTRFARLRMKERGLLSDRSPRGIWELTPDGRAYLSGDLEV